MKKILLIDDEKNLLRTVSLNLSSRGFFVDTALSAEVGFSLFNEKRHDIILCDLKLQGISGIDLLSKIRRYDKDVIFIVITAFGTIKQAVDAMKLGADDFISKPVDIDGLIENLKIALQKRSPEKIGGDFHDENIEKIKKDFIFKSNKMEEILKEVVLTSKSVSNVLITGETGTGKEVLAKMIHSLSERKGDFVPINLSAIPIDLMESELFGHEKGSFTGAVFMQKGKFEIVKGGSLFLDEIGEMPFAMQAKLLRVIQEKEFSRLGSNLKIELNARIICATNVNLEENVIEKKFREDLFYRINVLHFKIPPLRERRDDIPALANFFAGKYSAVNKKNIKAISKDTINILMSYDFPGNIRELENIIERAVVVATSDVIEPPNLPKTMFSKQIQTYKNLTGSDEGDIKLDEVEINLIKNALQKNNYNQTKTAISLGISRKQLITKVKKYGLFRLK
jgi:DNA-binding NtrC family response regulator